MQIQTIFRSSSECENMDVKLTNFVINSPNTFLYRNMILCFFESAEYSNSLVKGQLATFCSRLALFFLELKLILIKCSLVKYIIYRKIDY